MRPLAVLLLLVLAGCGPGRYFQEAGGHLRLLLWLQRAGFQVTLLASGEAPGQRLDALVVADPQGLDEGDAAQVMAWLAPGRTLVVAGVWPELTERLGVRLVSQPGCLGDLAQPLPNPPVQQLTGCGSVSFALEQSVPALVLSGDGSGQLLLVDDKGAGVYLLASPEVLTNQGLLQADNAAFVLNVLGPAQRVGVLLGGPELVEPDQRSVQQVDFSSGQPEGRGQPLSPWTWVALYGLVVVLGYLFWSGRLLGKPLPLPGETARSSSEYVLALAGMLRRSGARRTVAEQYISELRRAFGSRPPEPVQQLLTQLESKLGEAELVRLAAEAHRLLEEHYGQRW